MKSERLTPPISELFYLSPPHFPGPLVRLSSVQREEGRREDGGRPSDLSPTQGITGSKVTNGCLELSCYFRKITV